MDLAYIAGDDSGGGIGEKGGGEEGEGGEGGATFTNIREGGFTQPILVSEKNGLDLVLPHNSFSVVDVESYVGQCFVGSLETKDYRKHLQRPE